MREVTFADALVSLRPGASWSSDGTVDGIEWLDTEQSKPSKRQITEEVKRLVALRAATEYQSARASAYPSIGDQLDALFHAGVFPPEMEEQIAAVKSAYPKPDVVSGNL